MISPLYKLKPNVQRLMFPQYFYMFLLAISLFFAIWLNLWILEVNLNPTFMIIMGTVILILVMINIFIIYTRDSKMEYLFYKDRILQNNINLVTLKYANNVTTAINHIDRIFNTNTILIDNKKLVGIKQNPEIIDYIKSLIAFNKK